MATLELQQPFETTEPRLRVENILLPGRHRFRLIVVDNDGIESDPVDTLVTIVGPAPRSAAVVKAREARGRAFYARGVLLSAPHLDADQLHDHGWLGRALAYLHGSGTLAGLEVTWEKATGGCSERLVVKPGIALDRLGRIIEVPRDADLSLDRWFAGQSDAHLIGGFKPSLQGVVADVFLHLLPGGPGQGDGYEVKLYLRQEPDPPPLPSPAWPVFTRTDGARREQSSRRGTGAGPAGWARRTKAAPSRSPNTPSDRILRRCSSRAWSSRPPCRPRAGGRFAPRRRWWLTTAVGGLCTLLPRSPGGSACDAGHRCPRNRDRE